MYKTLLDTINDGSFYYSKTKPRKCCDKPNKVYDYVYAWEVCSNCGIVGHKIEVEDTETKRQSLNPLYDNATIMGNTGRYRSLKRIHNWKDKKEIKEINANIRYKEIEDICKNYFKTNIKQIYKKASYYYMEVYLNQSVCSRGNIRFSNYIYCIYKATLQMNIEVDIIDLINSVNKPKITIKNFNDSLVNMKRLLTKNHKNINKDFLTETQELYIHKDLDKYRDLLNNNYDLNYSQRDFIKAYNVILKNARKKYKKINYKNILLGTVLRLTNNKDIIKFCEVFEVNEKSYYYGEKLLN